MIDQMIQIMQRHMIREPAWWCGIIVLLIMMTALDTQAAEPASGSSEQQTTQLATNGSQLPPRLRELELEQLMNIEVTTVMRRESTVGESASAISVITQEDIRRSGATTIAELFRRVPGMNVVRSNNSLWTISARGFIGEGESNKLLVLMDGRTLYNPLFSGTYWDAVDYPLGDIERIEVIRGPGASVWGANAVNGVINIITKSAKDTQGGLLSAGAGNQEKGFGTLRYGGKSEEDLFFRVYGKGFDRDEQFSSTADPNDDWQGGSGGFRFDRQKSQRDTITFQGDFLRSEAGYRKDHPQTGSPFVFTSTDPDIHTNINLLGRWTHQVSEDSKWSVQLYWDRFERQVKAYEAEVKWETYDLDIQHQVTWAARHNIVYGVGARLIEISTGDSENDNGFILSWDQSQSEDQTFSAFVQDDISLIENKASLILGLKFEHNDLTGFEAAPTLRLRWTPDEHQTVWAAVSRAVRTPSVSEDSIRIRLIPVSSDPPVFPLVVGNPDLESEILWAYELGYRVQPTDKFSVDSALFYNRYHDYRAPLPGAVEPGPEGTLTFPISLINGLDVETYGAELAATWQVTRQWRLYAAYAFLKINVQPKDPRLPPETGVELEEESPDNQVYVQSSWDLSGSVEFDLMGRYVENLSKEGTADSYVALDARLAWRPRKNLTLELVGQNLFDNHHFEFGENITESEDQISNLVEIERSVYGKVMWHF